MFKKDLYFLIRNFVIGVKMEPGEIAGIVIDRVVDYCRNNSGDTTLQCMEYHSPDQLDVFIDGYLTEEEDNELEKEIENSDSFWDELRKQYDKLWGQEIGAILGNSLADTLSLLYENIIQNDELDDARKARRLKAYAEVLDGFGDAIKRALQERKPLSERDLDYWYTKLGDSAFGVKNYNYYEEIGYDLGYYDTLDDNDKLEVLSILLDEVGNVLYDIANKSELGALRNS